MAELDQANVNRLLAAVDNPDARNDTAAQLSKVAAKAEGARAATIAFFFRVSATFPPHEQSHRMAPGATASRSLHCCNPSRSEERPCSYWWASTPA